MPKLNFLFVGFLVVGAMAVAAQDRVDRNTDFSKYKSYKWVSSKGAHGGMDPVDAQIAEALDTELARTGLAKTDSDAADLLLCYHSAVGEKTFSKYQSEWGSSWFTIDANQVAVEMYDSSTKNLVWRNTGYISSNSKPQDIAKAASKLLKDYPPKRK